MPANPALTHFAPAERATSNELCRQAGHFSETSLTHQILDAVPSQLMILNDQRQIVYANKTLLDLVAVGEQERLIGLRPGEALGCIHARESEGGCGTTEECSTCGAVLAILASLRGEQAVRECRVTRCREGQMEALDLQIWTTPLAYEGESFTIFAVSDISHEKRRRALEKIFFHDILNLVGGIKGFADLLQTGQSVDTREIFELVQSAAAQTIDEIQAQRILAAAESRELQLNLEPLPVGEFLGQLVRIYAGHEVAKGRGLSLDPPAHNLVLTTDRTLLGRVLGNMIKNALEASAPGEAVTVGCRSVGDKVIFVVNNPGIIPRESRLQIFQRSFSTKGPGRGLGTYSMRLLTEYLQGEIAFTSTEDLGTTFFATYPRVLAPA